MPRYPLGSDERRWEIIYHQAFYMWETVDFDTCPFSLHYAWFAGLDVQSCLICGAEAEPAVFLRGPETGPSCAIPAQFASAASAGIGLGAPSLRSLGRCSAIRGVCPSGLTAVSLPGGRAPSGRTPVSSLVASRGDFARLYCIEVSM